MRFVLRFLRGGWVLLICFSIQLAGPAACSEIETLFQGQGCGKEWVGILGGKVKEYEEAVRLKPDDADVRYNLGVAYSVLGRWNEAVSTFKDAVQLKSDHAAAHYGLGVAYVALGDQGAAMQEYSILRNMESNLAGYLLNYISEQEKATVSSGK